LAYFEGVREK